MIDIHSHILPDMDDGCRSVEESLELLARSAAQGVGTIAATPHFYPEENDISGFLERRAASAEKLRAAWQPGHPELLLGAEVYYFEGVSRAEGLEALRIEGAELLLLEMPFERWSERMVYEAVALHAREGFTVALAHVERYLRYRNGGWLKELRKIGVKTQCNAGFLLHPWTRRRALRMLRNGEIDLLGSDCHDRRTRPPNLGPALALLEDAERETLAENARRLTRTLSHP